MKMTKNGVAVIGIDHGYHKYSYSAIKCSVVQKNSKRQPNPALTLSK